MAIDRLQVVCKWPSPGRAYDGPGPFRVIFDFSVTIDDRLQRLEGGRQVMAEANSGRRAGRKYNMLPPPPPLMVMMINTTPTGG